MFAHLLCTREITCTICDDNIAVFSDNYRSGVCVVCVCVCGEGGGGGRGEVRV